MLANPVVNPDVKNKAFGQHGQEEFYESILKKIFDMINKFNQFRNKDSGRKSTIKITNQDPLEEFKQNLIDLKQYVENLNVEQLSDKLKSEIGSEIAALIQQYKCLGDQCSKFKAELIEKDFEIIDLIYPVNDPHANLKLSGFLYEANGEV